MTFERAIAGCLALGLLVWAGAGIALLLHFI